VAALRRFGLPIYLQALPGFFPRSLTLDRLPLSRILDLTSRFVSIPLN